MRRINYILLAALSLSTPIYALVTVVPSGTTETATLNLPNDGDGAIIEKGGVLATGASDGVFMDDSNQTVLNQGRISTTGNNAEGIVNNGGTNAVITNSGLILTEGLDSEGIVNSSGASAVITNNGQISTTGIGGSFSAHGIATDGGASTVITNNGQISTLGAIGIFNINANDVVITNNGRISTEFGNHGIFNNGDNVVITNSGLILAEGSGIANSDIGGNSVHIINSGTIISNFFALSVGGDDPTVTLLRGSNLQGRVEILGGDPLTLNVETGLNLALTLQTGSFGSLGIEAPFVLLGDTIAVLDPTGLALQADVLADLSDTILDGVYRHKPAFSCKCIPCRSGVWAQGIGSYRKRSRDKDFVSYDNWQGGFLLGFDINLCRGNIGLFSGVSFGKAEVDKQTQRADITSYVGGVTYERLFCNTFLGLALAVGYVDWENERFVMDNLVDGGVERAKADTGGAFVSPEVTLAHRFTSLWCNPTMSFTFRYAGLFLGNYSEKGSSTNLSVKDREIELLTTRFEVALPYTATRGICCWSIEPYVGVFGRYQVAGNCVDAEFLGQTLRFDSGSPRNLAAFLFGFRGIQSRGCFNLFLNLEGSFDNYSSSRILGEGGIGFSF